MICDVNFFIILNVDIKYLSDTSDVLPQKRHKKHKHKKHKKKKLMHDNDVFVDITADTDRKKSFRIKMKKEDERRYMYQIFL